MTIINNFTKKKSQEVNQAHITLPDVWSFNSGYKNSGQSAHASLGGINQSSHKVISSKTDDLTREIIKMLDSAKSTAVICSFLLADEKIEQALIKAADRGVRIYLMLACETRLDKETSDDDFEKDCIEQHSRMLNALGGKVLIRSAPHYHAKVVLVDAMGENVDPQGILLTANLTSEALQRNEELGIFLSKEEIQELVPVMKWAFFEDAQHQMLDNKKFEAVQPLGQVEHPSGLEKIVVTQGKNRSIREQALSLIARAENEIVVSSFGWQQDHDVVQSLIAKSKAGVKVTVLARIRGKGIDALRELKAAGAEVYGFKWLHAKAICVDSSEAMVMSANLEKHGLDEGFELGLRLSGSSAEEVKKELLKFQQSAVAAEFFPEAKLGDLNGKIRLQGSDNKFEDIEVERRVDIKLPEVKADCITEMDMEVALPKPPWKDNPVHVIHYTWQVVPPILPKDVKEQMREIKVEHTDAASDDDKNSKKFKIVKKSYAPKVYSNKSNRYIAIFNENELSAAINLRQQYFKNAKIVIGNV